MTQHLLGIWLYYDFNKAPVRLRAVPIFLLEFVEPRKKKSRKPARGERKNKQEKEEKKNIIFILFFLAPVSAYRSLQIFFPQEARNIETRKSNYVYLISVQSEETDTQ